jgi:hypothetical protein
MFHQWLSLEVKMTNENQFVFQKSFSGTADTGVTFHWLKCAFAQNAKDAVSAAFCLVHFSAVLAASAESSDRERVIAALEWSQRKFDRWMELALLHKSMSKSIPQRVLVDFVFPLDDSDVGQTLARLSKDESRTLTQHVLDAVLLVYRPVALSALKDPSLELTIQCSRTVFSRRMDLPGYPSPMGEVSKVMVEPSAKPTILLNSSQASSVEAQRPDVPNGLLEENLLTGKDVAGLSEGAQIDYMPEIDMDYDF